MSTGISVNDECLSAYQDLKLKRKYKYILFKLADDNQSIDVEKTVSLGTYDDFLASLPSNDCRYAVLDFEYSFGGSEGIRNKICFYVWAPDTASIKQKMLYAASKDALRKKLVGIASEIQCTDFSEVSYETVFERVAR